MNPFLKTFTTQAVALFGAFATSAVDQALTHPTGGLLGTLNAHPDIAAVYVGLANLAHNYLSHLFPAPAEAK